MKSATSKWRVFPVMLREQPGQMGAGINHSSIDEVPGIDLTNGWQRTNKLR
jgi:hypothetical protein